MIEANDILAAIAEVNEDIDILKIDHDKLLNLQGLDSLDMLQVYYVLETKYNITIDLPQDKNADDMNWRTVNSIIEGLNRLVK